MWRAGGYSACVPTLGWHSTLTKTSAPRPMIEEFERDWGVTVVHGWGMTEMSPVGSLTLLEALDR